MILTFGDLHFYDGPVGHHLNYEENTDKIMDQITSIVEEAIGDLDRDSNEQLYVVFTNDLSGVKTSAKRFKTRTYALKVLKFFMTLNALTNSNVYGLRGNHDISVTDISELDFLIDIGVVKTAKYFDSPWDKTRIHLFDYDNPLKEAELHPEYKNIAVTHHNLAMEGIKMPFYAGEPIYVEQTCLKDMDVIFGGHIHYPIDFITKTMDSGNVCSLAYLGCPTRPTWDAKMWNHYYVGIVYNSGEYSLYQAELQDWKEVFDLKALEDPEVFNEYNKIENEDLLHLVETLLSYDDEFYKDMEYQIEKIPGYSDNARAIAKKYYEKHSSKK